MGTSPHRYPCRLSPLPHYTDCVLLSDRDIRTQIRENRVSLEPYEPAMLQPSSIDVRLDR